MISIITVCHNSAELMSAYVDSFLEHNGSSVAKDGIEFIFVENSGDARTETFAEALRGNGYVAHTIHVENRGFGAGCNSGAKLARGELLVFANPDIRFLSDLTQIGSHFDEKSWGTVRQTDGNGATHAFDLLPEYRTVFTELARLFKYLHRIPLLHSLCYPVGSFMIIPRWAFTEENGFDERFFLYYEEAELSRRLHTRLGPPKYCSDIVILHQTFGTQSNREFTFGEEARGMVTYANVIGQPHLAERRLKTLRRLAVLSPTSAKRIPFLRDAITAAEGKVARATHEE